MEADGEADTDGATDAELPDSGMGTSGTDSEVNSADDPKPTAAAAAAAAAMATVLPPALALGEAPAAEAAAARTQEPTAVSPPGANATIVMRSPRRSGGSRSPRAGASLKRSSSITGNESITHDQASTLRTMNGGDVRIMGDGEVANVCAMLREAVALREKYRAGVVYGETVTPPEEPLFASEDTADPFEPVASAGHLMSFEMRRGVMMVWKETEKYKAGHRYARLPPCLVPRARAACPRAATRLLCARARAYRARVACRVFHRCPALPRAAMIASHTLWSPAPSPPPPSLARTPPPRAAPQGAATTRHWRWTLLPLSRRTHAISRGSCTSPPMRPSTPSATAGCRNSRRASRHEATDGRTGETSPLRQALANETPSRTKPLHSPLPLSLPLPSSLPLSLPLSPALPPLPISPSLQAMRSPSYVRAMVWSAVPTVLPGVRRRSFT